MSKEEITPERQEALKRLKGFVRKASEVPSKHDPERLERWKRGKQNAPHIASWAEIARDLRRR